MRKTLITAVAAVACGLGIAACNGSNGTKHQANTIESQQQAALSLHYDQVQPVPFFNYSQYRKTLTEVEAIQALGTQTTSFFFNMGVAQPIFECPSLGMPVPNTASLTNPLQATWNDNGTNGNAGVAIGQLDPNGIYAPASSSGTNVVCVNSAGQPYIQYWEGFVDTVSGAAH